MVAGIVAHFGASIALLYTVFIIRDLLGTFIEPGHLDWLLETRDTRSGGWFVVQAVSLLSSVISGLVARMLSPARSQVAIGLLLLLAVVTVFFAQLPSPRSALVVGIWALATPVGIVIGAYLAKRVSRAPGAGDRLPDVSER